MGVKVIRPDDIREEIISFFKNKSLIPIVGAGLTCGIKSWKGNVPSGEEYKSHMLSELSKSGVFTNEEMDDICKENFSDICDYYEDDEIIDVEERKDYWKRSFYQVHMEDDYRRSFLEIDWPYIYSLNIDDGIENSSSFTKVILPNRGLREDILNEEKCVIKLHGDINELVTYETADKIFSTKEYAVSIEKNATILGMLRNDFQSQNILFIGCSLSDEIDLKTINILPIDHQNKEELRKTIIFVKGTPTRKQQSKFNTYGITDVVCFEEYQQMYEFIFNAWEESQKIQDGELDFYTAMPQTMIPATEIEENWKYFFFGKSLFNNKNGQVNIPYFFIERNLSAKIVKNLLKNKVHLVNGPRVSGKTYCLIELFTSIKDRATYYFDGRTRLSQHAMDMLMKKANIVALFDVGALTKDQFEIILQNAKMINKNGNNYVICLNANDSDSLGVVKWKLRQGYINDDDIISYDIKNKLSYKSENNEKNEISEINQKYPVLMLPPYEDKKSFVDQIMYAEDMLDVKSRYSKLHISIQTEKQLALLILLAIKEKMYSLEIEKYRLDVEIADAIRKYDPLIERTEVNTFEKDNRDLSSVKYTVNSRYWLRRELGEFARKEENKEMVANAYFYIIECVKHFTQSDDTKQREACRDLVRFDIMNDIFLDRYKGNIGLIVCIFTKLYPILAEDFNFIHQNAKCYLNYYYYAKDESEKRGMLTKASRQAVVAREMVENKIQQKYSEKLCISLAHVMFTNAVIACEICRENNYSDVEEIEKALIAVKKAWEAPYNDREKQKDKSNHSRNGTVRFISELIDKIDICRLSKKAHDLYDELVTSTLNF